MLDNVLGFIGRTVSQNPKAAVAVAIVGAAFIAFTGNKNKARAAMGGGPGGFPSGKKPDMEGGSK